MSKYIDADKLKAVLANHYQEITVPVITEQGGIESYFRRAEIHDILNIITSLQQEQPEVFDTIAFQKGVKEGKRLMMEGAEECELYWDGDFLAIDLNMRELGYSERDKVNIIILPKEV